MTGNVYRGVTIDSAHSKDLDDAIWVEPENDGWAITVCISLVGDCVERGSETDLTALERGFTLYAGQGVTRPMLPDVLSEGDLSLTPGADKAVLALTMRLDNGLKVRSCEVTRGVLDNRGRLSHEEAVRVMQDERSPLHGMMTDAWRVASGLLAARRHAGALAFFSAASGVMTDEEGRLIDLGKYRETSRAYIIVQELMILANATLAEYFVRKGVRLLFRNHRSNPVADRVSLSHDLEIAASGSAQAVAAAHRLGMMLERATLSPQATGHFALNLPVYAWFTSPIRRYADLVNQRVALALVDGRPSPYSGSDLAQIADSLNAVYLRESEVRASRFRNVSRQAAAAALDRDAYAELDDLRLTAVIKEAHEEAGFPEALCAEIENRLASNGLTEKDIGRLLLSGQSPSVREIAVRYLAANAHRAVSVTNYLQQDRLVDSVEWTEGQDGALFTSDVVLVTSASTFRAFAKAGTKKAAQQKATAMVLASMAGIAWEEPDTAPREEPVRVVSAPSAGDPNTKGTLITFCQGRGFGLPVFEVQQSGPSHKPVFRGTVTVDVNGSAVSVGPFDAPSRRDAERLAAMEMLRHLDVNVQATAAKPVKAENTAHLNAKTVLQEYCHKHGLPLPAYEVSETGPSHRPTFTASAIVVSNRGRLTSPAVSAASRKDAEKLAADRLLSMLKQRDVA